MTWSVTAGLVAVALVAILVLLALIARPGLADSVPGKVFSFLGLFVLPVGVAVGGFQHHMEVSKSTAFCLSCHVMQQYGDSLYVDDADYLSAGHFQNNRIPRDQACYTCHTNYAMFGGFKAKMNGMRHLWVQFTGSIPDEIELYEPYNNRECLHCHQGARSYEETMPHEVMLEELAANESSCLDCHNQAHAIGELSEKGKWHPGGGS